MFSFQSIPCREWTMCLFFLSLLIWTWVSGETASLEAMLHAPMNPNQLLPDDPDSDEPNPNLAPHVPRFVRRNRHAGISALQLAAQAGHLECARILIDAGAIINRETLHSTQNCLSSTLGADRVDIVLRRSAFPDLTQRICMPLKKYMGFLSVPFHFYVLFYFLWLLFIFKSVSFNCWKRRIRKEKRRWRKGDREGT